MSNEKFAGNENNINGKINHSNGEIILGVKNNLSENGFSETKINDTKDDMPVVEQLEGPQSSLRNDFLGFSLGIVASLLIAIGTGCTQALEGAVPDLQLAALRAAAQFAIAGIPLIFKQQLPKVPKDKTPWLGLYCALVLIVSVTNFMGVTYIAAGVASCVRRSVNILSITVFATLLLRERPNNSKIIAVILAISGIIVMIQPWYEETEEDAETKVQGVIKSRGFFSRLLTLFPGQSNQLSHSYYHVTYENTTKVTTSAPSDGDDDSDDDWLGYTLSATAGFFAAVTAIIQKAKLTGIDPLTLNVWAGLSGAIVAVIVSAIAEDMRFSSEVDDILFVVGQSLTWGMAAVLAIWAVSLTSPVIVTLSTTTQIVFLLIGQYTVLSHIEPGIGNWVEIFGAVLVLFSALIHPVWQIIEIKLQKDSESCSPCTKKKPEHYETAL